MDKKLKRLIKTSRYKYSNYQIIKYHDNEFALYSKLDEKFINVRENFKFQPYSDEISWYTINSLDIIIKAFSYLNPIKF